ncbi:hypothetical protein BTU63_03810 [Streptococcus rubneri]|nr:hypothetical protein [Streptococcus rubneri]
MVDFADYPVESQSFPRGQKAIFEAKGRSMDHWREEGKVWAALSFLVQILVQKVIQHQKKPVTRGLCLISFNADCEHSNCFNELQSTIIYRI